MPHYYDEFDYPKFWQNRRYEHESELICLSRIFSLLPHLETTTLAEIGSGFGRLSPFYLPKVKNALLVEPSFDMRTLSQTYLSDFHNFSLIDGDSQNTHIKEGSVDTVLSIRVFHHLEHPDPTIAEFSRILKPQGHLILEFANKNHFKNTIKALLAGSNPSLQTDEPLCRKSVKSSSTITFVNHNPNCIINLLKNTGFSLSRVYSVSNFRSSLFKKALPLPVLLFLERTTQSLLGRLFYGPSLILLAQKTTGRK